MSYPGDMDPVEPMTWHAETCGAWVSHTQFGTYRAVRVGPKTWRVNFTAPGAEPSAGMELPSLHRCKVHAGVDFMDRQRAIRKPA